MIDNVSSVIAAAIFGFAVGVLWYSPIIFGRLWTKEVKVVKKEVNRRGHDSKANLMVASLLTAVTTAIVLDLLLDVIPGIKLIDSLILAFLIWVGFLATSMLNHVFWEGRSFNLYLLGTGQQLATLLVMTLILYHF